MYHIIINPASRSGRGRKIWEEQIEPQLQQQKIPFQPHFSQSSGDVARIAQEIYATFKSEALSDEASGSSEKMLQIIILGGDGTVNEFIQTLDPSLPVLVGYIPTGSSNDLARDLGIPKQPEKALELILKEERTLPMDIGVLSCKDGTVRRFAVSCGIGYDAAVCEETFRSKIKAFFNKIKLGKLSYLIIALKQLMATKPQDCTLILDGKAPIHIKNLYFVACMNHRYEGGGFMFSPDANPCDGFLNLCTAGNLSKLKVLIGLPFAFFGKHYRFRGIEGYQASHIEITTAAPLWTHTDGELGPKTDSITVSCQQGALRMIVP